jgi:hypothetical protein
VRSKADSNFDSYLKLDLATVPAFSKSKLRLFAGLSGKDSDTATIYAAVMPIGSGLSNGIKPGADR